LKNQIELQYSANKAIKTSIESDLNSLVHELHNLAQYYQTNAYVINEQSKIITQQQFEEINKITSIKTFFETDKEFKIIYNIDGDKTHQLA
jgi:hypothetical protein